MKPTPPRGAAPVGQITFPPEWKLGHEWAPGFPELVLTHQGADAFVVGGVLDDGTNLLGMCWPGGQRLLRASPDTGWALEERFDGTPPADLARAWSIVVDSQVAARKRAAS